MNDSIRLTDSSVARTTIVNGRQETNEGSAAIDSDALLQASRRVDWRFLLPDPELGHVAYVGPPRGTLLASLKLFSASLTVIETPQAYYEENVTQYDVVVTSGPTYETLRWTVDRVRQGGFLYIEAYGLFQLGKFSHRVGRLMRLRRPELRYPIDYITAVKQLGLVDANAFWFWPNFETCTKVIPLDDHTALSYLFAQRHPSGSIKAQLKAKLGHWFLQSGLLMRLIPSFGIVAQRSAATISSQ